MRASVPRCPIRPLCGERRRVSSSVVQTLLTPAEIAERWHVRRARIYGLIADGVLPVVRIGRSVRVPLSAAEAFIAAGGTPTVAPHEARP